MEKLLLVEEGVGDMLIKTEISIKEIVNTRDGKYATKEGSIKERLIIMAIKQNLKKKEGE